MPLDYVILIDPSQMFYQNIYKNPRKEGMKEDRGTGKKGNSQHHRAPIGHKAWKPGHRPFLRGVSTSCDALGASVQALLKT